MKILTNITEEHEGNDCMILNSLSVVESNGSNYLFYHHCVRGNYSDDYMRSIKIDSKEDARKILMSVSVGDFTDDEINILFNY